MSEGSNSKQSSAAVKSIKHLLAGGIAGSVSRTAVAPLERVKILMQVQQMMQRSSDAPAYRGMSQSLAHIWKHEGMRGMFKGNGINVARVFPYAGLQFFGFETIKTWMLRPEEKELDVPRRLLAGALAGVFSSTMTYPLDFVRARLTVQDGSIEMRYTGVMDAFKKIAQEEGVWAMYRGLAPSLLGIAPYVGLNFTVFETLKVKLTKKLGHKPSALHLLFIGAFAGACGQTAAYPLDLLRRRFQMQGHAQSKVKYRNMRHACQVIYASEGIAGFYRGLWVNQVKVVPTIAVMFTTNELLKPLFGL